MRACVYALCASGAVNTHLFNRRFLCAICKFSIKIKHKEEIFLSFIIDASNENLPFRSFEFQQQQKGQLDNLNIAKVRVYNYDKAKVRVYK